MYTRIINKSFVLVGLIGLGGIILLFSMFSSVMSFVVIGLVVLLVAFSTRNRNRKVGSSGSKESIVVLVVLLPCIAVISSGCTINVPMRAISVEMGIKEKLPIKAGLLISEDTRAYVFKGNPESFTASARPHEFPLGNALEDASMHVFSQIFEEVHIIRTAQEATEFDISVEPQIQDFHFRYNQLNYAGFAIAVFSKIRIHVTLANGETRIWEKSIESAEHKKGPWVVDPNYEVKVGESATEALSSTLKEIAAEIVSDKSVWWETLSIERTKRGMATNNTENRLSELKEVYESGLITKEEYDVKRKELIEEF